MTYLSHVFLCGYETLFLHFKMLKLNEVLASYSSFSPFIHSLLFNHFSSGIFLLFYEESLEFHHNLRIILKILLFRESYIPLHLFLEILINMSPFHSLRLFNHIIYLYICLSVVCFIGFIHSSLAIWKSFFAYIYSAKPLLLRFQCCKMTTLFRYKS